MQLNVQQLVLLALLSGALHWFIARSTITQFFWSQTSGWLDKLLRCAACSCFWIGLCLALVVQPAVQWWSPPGEVLATGLLTMITGPWAEALLLAALDATKIDVDGSAN